MTPGGISPQIAAAEIAPQIAGGAGGAVEVGGAASWWSEPFSPFGWTHLGMVLMGVGLTLAWVMWGRWTRGRGGDQLARSLTAGAMLAHQSLMQIYWLAPGRFEWDGSLPLHVCDLGAWLSPVALLAPWRWLRVLIIFWGLGLTTQAFITPTVKGSPAEMQFWFYWFNHLAIVSTAVYLLAVDRVRPRWPETWGAIGGTFGYVMAIAVVNRATGWNYAFVGPGVPGSPTIVDALGPYPLRIAWIVLIGSGLFVVIWGVIRVTLGAERAGATRGAVGGAVGGDGASIDAGASMGTPGRLGPQPARTASAANRLV